jgi:hypothetical protein
MRKMPSKNRKNNFIELPGSSKTCNSEKLTTNSTSASRKHSSSRRGIRRMIGGNSSKEENVENGKSLLLEEGQIILNGAKLSEEIICKEEKDVAVFDEAQKLIKEEETEDGQASFCFFTVILRRQ